MKLPIAIALLIGAIAFMLFWFLSAPRPLTDIQFSRFGKGDPVAGEAIFWAGGCGSCHAEKSAKGDAKKRLGGGHRLVTPAGVFVTPNISPDKEYGLGNWSLRDFANAMQAGVSPDGSHYYPSFPYTSYSRMRPKDISDLWAFLKTLPSVSKPNEKHELALPFKLRRGIGLWKSLFLSDKKIVQNLPDDPKIARGQYLVEGAGHCGECHTPRSVFGFGGAQKTAWLSGGPAPEGDGKIPNITPNKSGIGSWSEADIAYYLESGFTPDFDSVGGSMVSVQDNMTKLAPDDRAAIAAYLKAIPAIGN